MKQAIVWSALVLILPLAGCGQPSDGGAWYAAIKAKLGLAKPALSRVEGEAGEHLGHAAKPQEAQEGGMAGMSGMGGQGPEAQAEMPPGSVMVSPMRQQLSGVRTAVVEVKDLETTVRTVGRVDYDERKLARIHTKIEGWIEEIFVDFTGKSIKKGDPLFSVYSPDLVATQEEYLLALNAKQYLEGSPVQGVAQSGHSLLEAAKRRLLLWDITEQQIQELEQTGTPKKSLTLYSPISGVVVKKEAYQGVFVKPEMELYAIADLSTIWVNADIYEYEAPFVKVGQQATVTLSYFPSETFQGRLVYLYPYLKEKTRTLRARFEFRNTKDFKLKPEMFANVDLKIEVGRKLAVPEEAVIDTGTRQVVFVDQGDGMFEPRDVKLGAKVDEYYEVLSGLSKGEKVVTSANFLIDSESRLKAATGGMGGMPGMDMGKNK